jgi:hypothetical protein
VPPTVTGKAPDTTAAICPATPPTGKTGCMTIHRRDDAVVCVPATEDFWGVSRGAAIVTTRSTLDTGGDVDVWVEGNVAAASNVVTFGDCVLHAVERMTADYPTSARRRVPARELVVVARWDSVQRAVTEPDVTLLGAWLGRPPTSEDLTASR